MKILILSQADTSIKYFLKEHVSSYLRANNCRVDFELLLNYYDICLFSENSTNLRTLEKLKIAEKYVVLDPKMNSRNHIYNVKKANGAIVSSFEQAEKILEFQSNIQIQPWFRFAKDFVGVKTVTKKPGSAPNIVYHGNKVHLEAIGETLGPALEKLSYERNIVFSAIYNIRKLGKWKKALPKNVQIRHIQWESATYLNHISEADIGVIPNFLPIGPRKLNYVYHKLFARLKFGTNLNIDEKDYLNRYKFTANSGRLYEFALLEKPVVAEPSISISQDIEHEKTGYLALSSAGWYKYLLKLIDEPDLRRNIGISLKQEFFAKHNKDIYLEGIFNFIQDLYNSKI